MFCSRYGTGTLTQVFLDRVFQECLTYEGEMVIFIVVDVPVNAIYHFNLSTEMKYFLGCHYLFGITVIYIGHLRLELRLL